MRSRALLFALALGLAATGIAQRPQNPFAAPAAKFQYAPDRVCDLLHLAVTLDVDYPARKVVGRSVNTMAALRDGVSEIVLHAGKNLKIEGVKVDGADAKFERKEDELHIAVHPLVRGEKVQIEVAYNFGKGESDGWNWVEPKGKVANREGFFTQGETNSNSEWAPTWDYPNDFTTSETTTTVPAGWDVIGNGVLVSDEQSKDGKRRTFHWKLDMPHATYLLSLCGGPFDIKRDNWKGVPLLYVVPKGMGNLIDYSFGNTKDMLSFFSDKLGVKYPWPKYAQDAMFDFGGGMENVSATTLGEGSLTDPRAGEHQMDWVNSHELGHQWFGDFVTCKDWGHIWLNESFATFMEMIYIEHARGKNAFEQDVESDMQQYFDEAKHYKRPLVTNFYADPGAMFDRHTYPKGGVILHTLRKQLGDKVFFQGLHDYLTKHAHEPVESQQLCRSMTESSGIDLEPFWNQWIYKPGHPVIDWSWSWDEAKKEVVVHVKQTQDTTDGAPIYDVPTHVALVGDTVDRRSVHLNAADQEFRFGAGARPKTVLFDPDHEFLREIPKQPWSAEELPFVLKLAPNSIDRQFAFKTLLSGTPDPKAIGAAVETLNKDDDAFPAITDLAPLADLKMEKFEWLYQSSLTHKNVDRRAQAVRALGKLKPSMEEEVVIGGLISDRQPYAVVAAAVETLGIWDSAKHASLIQKAAGMDSRDEVIRRAAFTALARARKPEALGMLLAAASPENSDGLRGAAIAAMGALEPGEPTSRKAIMEALLGDGFGLVFAALDAIGQRKDPEFLAALKEKQAKPMFSTRMRARISSLIEELSKKPG